jgi:hypothetical protein
MAGRAERAVWEGLGDSWPGTLTAADAKTGKWLWGGWRLVRELRR